jgi:hypothetical protein
MSSSVGFMIIGNEVDHPFCSALNVAKTGGIHFVEASTIAEMQ